MLHSPIGFGVTALNGRFLRVNRRLCRMLGYRSDELQQRTLYDVIHADDVEATSVAVGEMMRGESESVELERRFLGHGGMMLWGTLAVTLVRDDAGRPLHHIVQVEDVSEVRKANDLVTHMTLHDPLTGLPNRTLVLDRIGKALARGRRAGRRVAVLLCDLDHFRVINDHAGHEQGDTVLVEVARRIQRALRGGDTAGAARRRRVRRRLRGRHRRARGDRRRRAPRGRDRRAAGGRRPRRWRRRRASASRCPARRTWTR